MASSSGTSNIFGTTGFVELTALAKVGGFGIVEVSALAKSAGTLEFAEVCAAEIGMLELEERQRRDLACPEASGVITGELWG